MHVIVVTDTKPIAMVIVVAISRSPLPRILRLPIPKTIATTTLENADAVADIITTIRLLYTITISINISTTIITRTNHHPT